MMEKLAGLFVSLVGALGVLALIALGINLKNARDRSPGWLRRTLVAGLALLGLSGFSPEKAAAEDWVPNPHVQKEATRNTAPGATPTPALPRGDAGEREPDPPLPLAGEGGPRGGLPPPARGEGTAPVMENTESGVELMKIWSEAEEVASGKRGDHPFDRQGKERLLQDLARASGLIDSLVQSNSFQSPEGELLKIDLLDLVRAVQEKRPTEMLMATCYEAMMPTQIQDSFERLSARLPYLEKLALEKLSPEVAGKVLDKMTLDLKTLSGRGKPNSYEKIDEAKALELEARIGKFQEKIREALQEK